MSNNRNREGSQNATKRSHCHCKARRGPLTSLTARIIAAASQRVARRSKQRGQVHPRVASRPRASTSQRRILGAVRAGALVTATAAAATAATYQKEEGACQMSYGQINK